MTQPHELHSQSVIRVAVVGYGLGGSVFHAPLVSATPGMRLAAIVTANPERRAAAASAYPDASIVDRVEQLWEGDRAAESAIDLVVVTTPNASHAPLARAALDAGCHVVVDK